MSRRLLVLTLAALGLCLAARADEPSPIGQRIRSYGTTQPTYVRVPGLAFFPALSSWGYETAAFTWERWTEEGGLLVAPVALPAGARIVSLRFEFSDTSPDLAARASLVACHSTDACVDHPLAAAGPADCRIDGAVCSGKAFAGGRSLQTADLTPDDVTIDVVDTAYFLRVDQSVTDPGALRVAGLVVGYVLQVSPAPAAATFGDVPTSHPYFQFIEALGESGITAGCQASPALYCPDRPITRGEMAVYLAKALGLQWP